jgi:3-hydroxyacyl-CoA dehydrogenase
MQDLRATVTAAGATGIKKVGIIGAGAMGGGIAAQFADAGIAVELMDIAGSDRRTGPAEAGIARQLREGGFTDPEAADRIRPGNTDDHLMRLRDADWVIEAVAEDAGIKRGLFRKIAPYLKSSAILSSNTSTFRRAELVGEMEEDLARRFAITHFFNPPRLMPLLETVVDDKAAPLLRKRLHHAASLLLGKTPIDCQDTPGFIANRIGCFWIAVCVAEACDQGLDIETADAVQTVFGVSRTGVFGLLDLIGPDLVPTIWGGLMRALPEEDALQSYDLPDNALVRALLKSGSWGRKAGEGFYRRTQAGTLEVLDMDSLCYRAVRTQQAIPADLQTLLRAEGPAGNYARTVLRALIDYCLRHQAEIAPDAGAIDRAMQLGYRWRDGPFALAKAAGLCGV